MRTTPKDPSNDEFDDDEKNKLSEEQTETNESERTDHDDAVEQPETADRELSQIPQDLENTNKMRAVDDSLPSFPPEESAADISQKHGKTQTSSTTASTVPGKPASSAKSAQKRSTQLIIIIVAVLALMLAGVYLYASGTISGTPRAQYMSDCKANVATANSTRKLLTTAVNDAKSYQSEHVSDMSDEQLRNLTSALNQAEQQPAVPSCQLFADNATLQTNAANAKQLTSNATTLTKTLLLATNSQSTQDDDEQSASDGEQSTQQQSEATPSPTATSTTDTSGTSSNNTDSDSSSQSTDTKKSTASTPSSKSTDSNTPKDDSSDSPDSSSGEDSSKTDSKQSSDANANKTSKNGSGSSSTE